ncbi:MAG: hypothetical protein AAF434_01635 [Pseudomonadota bacterium]
MKNKKTKDEVNYVISHVVGDEAILESVYRPEQKPLFAIANQKGIHTDTEYITHSGKKYRPLLPSAPLLKHRFIKLPSGIGAEKTYEELVQSIRAYIHSYLDVSEQSEVVIAHYVLLTWVFDVFNEVPYLRIRGDFGTGKSRFLNVVGSICYRPIFANGSSTVSPIFHMLDTYGGTFVFDEADFRYTDETSYITKILNNGFMKGFPVLRSLSDAGGNFKPRAFNVFGAKIVAMRGNFCDQALESRFITETTAPRNIRSDIPLTLPPDFEDIATGIRNNLLRYRLSKLHEISSRTVSVPESLDPRVRQLVLPMLKVAESEGARAVLHDVAEEMNQQIQEERSWSPEARILEIIRDVWRMPNTNVSVKNITDTYLNRFGNDTNSRITTRWMGTKIRKSLGLKVSKSNGVFVVVPENAEKLARLYERYQIDAHG